MNYKYNLIYNVFDSYYLTSHDCCFIEGYDVNIK